jgi:serine/threonine protein kinase
MDAKAIFASGKLLGSGSYGLVKRVKIGDDYFAMKEYDYESWDAYQAEKEILTKLAENHGHHNIIKYYSSFVTSDKLYLMFEYIRGQDGFDFLESYRGISERLARNLFFQLVSAVHFCHSHGIYHRDIKLENVLIDKNRRLTLIDFGLAVDTADKRYDFPGTANYAAPELLDGIPYHAEKSDIWALGVCLYRLIFNDLPFDPNHDNVLHKRLKFPRETSTNLRILISGMLHKNPDMRPTCEQILKASWMSV